jgi:hypothetical protein
LKVENAKKFGAKVRKKGTSTAHNSSVQRKSHSVIRNKETGNPDFFGREIFRAGKFLPRKLKIAEKDGLKVFPAGFFMVRKLKDPKSSGRKFVRPGFSGPKIQRAGKYPVKRQWRGVPPLHVWARPCKPDAHRANASGRTALPMRTSRQQD